MTATTIIFHNEEGAQWPKKALDGYAKDVPTAIWLFEYLGWKEEGGDLLACEGVVDWPESDAYFPCNQKEFHILGGCLHLN